MMLHKISTSPFVDQSLLQCLKQKQPTDKLLLIQTNVIVLSILHGSILVNVLDLHDLFRDSDF